MNTDSLGRVLKITANSLIKLANSPSLLTSNFYKRILENVRRLPINFREGHTLSRNGKFSTLGLNEKKVITKRVGNRLETQLLSSIFIPKKHLFRGKNLNPSGIMTLLHEWSHINLTPNEEKFANILGFRGESAHEFFADLGAIELALKGGMPKEVIANHIMNRESYYAVHGASLRVGIFKMHKLRSITNSTNRNKIIKNKNKRKRNLFGKNR